MSYDFGIGPQVIAGPGSLAALPSWIAHAQHHRPLVITDPVLVRSGVVARLEDLLAGATTVSCVTSEPTLEIVACARDALVAHRADLILAIGGGSVIDTAKLAGALTTNDASLHEMAGDWGRVRVPPVPIIAIPTTVGTGSEMTRGAVFKDPFTATKQVIVSDMLFPTLAVLDPELLGGVPTHVIAASGCDALTQGIEGAISTAASPWTDALHLQGIRLISMHLARAVADTKDIEALGAMQAAAAMIGAGLAYSGVGAVHAIANTLGGHSAIPHGDACALMLAPVLRRGERVLSGHLDSVGEALLGGKQQREDRGGTGAADVVRAVARLVHGIGMDQRLGSFGVTEADLAVIAKESATHSDMASSRYQPGVRDIEAMLREVL